MSRLFFSHNNDDSTRLANFVPCFKAPATAVAREWYPHWEKGRLKEKVAVRQIPDEDKGFLFSSEEIPWAIYPAQATGGSRIYESHSSLFHPYNLPGLPLATYFQPITVPKFWVPYMQTSNPAFAPPKQVTFTLMPTTSHSGSILRLLGLHNQVQNSHKSMTSLRAAFPYHNIATFPSDQELQTNAEEPESFLDLETDPNDGQGPEDTVVQPEPTDFVDALLNDLLPSYHERSNTDEGYEPRYGDKSTQKCPCGHQRHFVRVPPPENSNLDDDGESEEYDFALLPADNHAVHQMPVRTSPSLHMHAGCANTELDARAGTCLFRDAVGPHSHISSDIYFISNHPDEGQYHDTSMTKSDSKSLRWRGRERIPRSPLRETAQQYHDQRQSKQELAYFPPMEAQETRGAIDATRREFSDLEGRSIAIESTLHTQPLSQSIVRETSTPSGSDKLLFIIDDDNNLRLERPNQRIHIERGRSTTIRSLGVPVEHKIDKNATNESHEPSQKHTIGEQKKMNFLRRLSKQLRTSSDKSDEQEIGDSAEPVSFLHLIDEDKQPEDKHPTGKQRLFKRFRARVEDA